jgi:hypothetical protein
MTRYAKQVFLAMNTWVRDSLGNGKPYDQMARELISVRH